MAKCLCCGNEFVQRHGIGQKFCSRTCVYTYQREHSVRVNKVPLVCAWCGKAFERIPSKVRGINHHYCSISCMTFARSEVIREHQELVLNPESFEKICETCGKHYTVEKPRDIVLRRYCSEDCARKAHKPKMLGVNNPNYKHGQNQRAARNVALHYFPHRCMICGWDISVDIHHVNPKRNGGKNSLDNLAVLCPNHHRMADMNLITSQELGQIVQDAIAQLPSYIRDSVRLTDENWEDAPSQD